MSNIRNQVKRVQNTIEELLLKDENLNSMRLSYITEFHEELFGKNLDNIYRIIKEKDPKMFYALEMLEEVSKDYHKTLISLNHLLDFEDRNERVTQLEMMQSKKIINVKEFKEIYGYSADWQKNRRSRLRDRLPYIQTVDGGKITYNVEDVEMWFINNNIRF